MRLKYSLGAVLATIAATAAVVAGVTQPAFASNPGTIVNYGSGMCLQPLAGPFQTVTDNGVRIAQMPCNAGVAEQQWQSVFLGQGTDPLDSCSKIIGCPVVFQESYYYIINQTSHKCLDVTDARTNDQAEIQQYDCNGGGSEKWYQRSYAFGRTQYVNSRTGKCLDVPNATTNATYIWQYHCTNSNVAQAYTFPS